MSSSGTASVSMTSEPNTRRRWSSSKMSSSGTASATMTSEPVDLFLVGKTGHGKSTTGNAILGREAFQVSDDCESLTNNIQSARARRFDREINVVDGPRVCETRLSKEDATKKMVEDMSKGIMECPQGFHAMLLVLKYGVRFTEEELATVMKLKQLFGPDFVRNFCIIIITHGENFDMNNIKTPNRTFEDWLRVQKGAIKELLKEVDNKAVLFYNLTPEKNEFQLKKLLEMVDGLKSRGARYTNELFKDAAATREQLIVKENAQTLREKIQMKINLLVDGLEKMKQHSQLNEEVKGILSQLRQDARNLETDITAEDKNTGVLDSLKQIVQNILQNVDSHEKVLTEKKEKSEAEAKHLAAQQTHADSMKKILNENKNASEVNNEMVKSGFDEYEKMRLAYAKVQTELRFQKEKAELEARLKDMQHEKEMVEIGARHQKEIDELKKQSLEMKLNETTTKHGKCKVQ